MIIKFNYSIIWYHFQQYSLTEIPLAKHLFAFTSASSPKEFLRITSFKCALSRASQRSASLCSLKGSRLNLTVPTKSEPSLMLLQ